MSANGNQPSSKLNKRQRRQLARTNLHSPQPGNGEENPVDSTIGLEEIPASIQNKPNLTEEISAITNGIPTLKLNVDEQLQSKHEVSSTSPEQVATAATESKNGTVDEDVASCSPLPTPPAARRRPIRIPITSAIPSPPPIEKQLVFPPRPKPGTLGTSTRVYANHFPVEIAPKLMLYQYDVVVEKPCFQTEGSWEEAMSRDQRRRFVQQLGQTKTIDFVFWYDEGKCLYSTVNLSQRQFPLVFTLPAASQERLRLSILSLAGQWSTSTIFDYLHSPNLAAPLSAIRILETLLKQALLPDAYCERSLFYRLDKPPEVLPDGFELRLGFFQSLCLTQAGLTLNLQTTLTKFYPSVDILEFISIYLRKDIRQYGMTFNDYEKAKTALNGCKIVTQQSNYTQVYQIRSFAEIPERQFFEFEKMNNTNGEDCKTRSTIKYNLVEYYAKEKKIQLKYLKFRCLQCYFLHDKRNPKHLPMEVCRILEWQECERESAAEQRDRQNSSIPGPGKRYKDIMLSLRSCKYRSPPSLPLCRAVQLTVNDEEMMLVNARILPPPVINNNRAEIKMGRINLCGNFVDPHSIKSLAFVYFGPDSPPLPPAIRKLMDEFVTAFIKMARRFGLGPLQVPLKDAVFISESDQSREQNIANIEVCFNNKKQKQCELIVCIMRSEWSDLRAHIKQAGTVTHGIATQCLLYSKLREQVEKFERTRRGNPDRILDNMCENLLRKINFKMQGINTQVSLPITVGNRSGTAASNKSKTGDAWQFMGADVIHPLCRQDRPSIAAVVGSGDELCSTSAVRVCKQWPRQGKCSIEAIVELEVMVTELLEYYREWNGRLPNKIVFYRDGVDDGQFARVLHFEIPQIKRAFAATYQDEPLPRLTFIVVKKRHHTRFFTLNEHNETANISPGLVVDTGIVHPAQFSFFLNSHKALQGTNRPALYHVLHDEIQFTADELQLLTYYLCFTDPRSSMSEAIPSLVHQADLAASNARDLFPETDTSTNDGYATDALAQPSLDDVLTEHLRVHENMRDTPHFG